MMAIEMGDSVAFKALVTLSRAAVAIDIVFDAHI